jgi:hypothetical protein
LRAYGLFAVTVLLVLLVARAFARMTERHTAAVRRALLR